MRPNNRYHVEPRYDFVLEPDGRLWMAMFARDTDVERPSLLMNADNTMTLKRRAGDIIQLTDIHPDALKILPNLNELPIVEVSEDQGIVRSYIVPIQKNLR